MMMTTPEPYTINDALSLATAHQMLVELRKRPNLFFVFVGVEQTPQRIINAELAATPQMNRQDILALLDRASTFVRDVWDGGGND